MRLHHTFFAAFCAAILTACGGDLSGGETTPSTPDTSTPDTPNTSTPDTTTPSLIPVEISTRLLDCPQNWNKNTTLCTETTEISELAPGILEVTLSQNKIALASEIVNASLTAGVLNTNASLTNAQGIAFFTVLANNSEGASRITVTSDAAKQDSSDSLNFTIGSSSVDIAIANDTNNTPLAQNATALITVTLTSEDNLYTTPVSVLFSSSCATDGTANLDKKVLTVNGVAQATYQPIGCVGDDVITANAEVNNLSINTTINVASSPADSIEFISASPTSIAVQGTGGKGRQETSKVLFKIVDQNGLATSLQEVEFELERAPSGATISPITAKTNSEGEVYTVVSAGAGSGILKVKVKISNPDLIISSVSSELAVSTGLPDQKSFSVSLENFSPEVLEYDGKKIGVSVELADHHNNAVPDGTTVFFHAEAGAINDKPTGTIGSCTTTGNNCSVNWVSGGDEPMGNKLDNQGLLYGCASSKYYKFAPCINSGGMGQPYGGRVTITAFAEGEEDFTDNNHDGLFTQGEAFTDDNCDSTYTYNEPFVDTNSDGKYTVADTYTDSDGSGTYNSVETYEDKDGNGSYTYAESFVDSNNDGVYNKAELYTDSDNNNAYSYAEAYEDLNGDGKYNYSEKYVDANNNGVYDAKAEDYVDSDGNGKYTAQEAFTDDDGDGKYTSPEAYVDINQIARLDHLTNVIIYNTTTDGRYTPEEPYTDSNGDGEYSGTEPYVDANNNGSYDLGEAFVDRNKDGLHSVYVGTDEPYTDTNGNNIFDLGEDFSDADNSGDYTPGDAYQDSNNDGHFTLAESFTDSDNNAVYSYAETFTDENNNNAYDSAEPYTEAIIDGVYTPDEAYTDSNFDGQYTHAEVFTDSDGNNQYSSLAEPFTDSNGDGKYTAVAEVYIDDDGNGEYTYQETFTDLDGNGKYTVRDSFVDTNGDNKYTGDTFIDRAEVFYDDNEDGQFKANKFKEAGTCNVHKDLQDDPTVVGANDEGLQDVNSDGLFTFGNGLFNGLTCSESEEALGNCERQLVQVSDNITLIMASKTQYIRVMNYGSETNHANLTTATGQSSVGLQIYIADIYNNRPPAETTISIATTNGTLASDASFKVPSSNAYGPYFLPVILTREATPNKLSSGILSITITTPEGTSRTYSVAVSDDG